MKTLDVKALGRECNSTGLCIHSHILMIHENVQIISLQTHAVVSSQMDPVKVITRLGVEDREFVETKEG